MRKQQSEQYFIRAQKSIPGGVNSPVRAFKSVGGSPLFIKKAKGSYLYDEDGNEFIDYIGSWGPMILGHAYPAVVEAIQRQAGLSSSFGAPTFLEIEIAELIKQMAPNVDLVRMVNSGTEACMSALRIARGYTGRNKLIKFDGCYHGHADPFLVKAGSGLATFNIETVPGVTKGVATDTLICPYNNLDAVEAAVRQNEDQIAAIILEPVAGNMGCIPPSEDFLFGLRKICDENGIVLIFDEVMTGFRLCAGGAQAYYGVAADLVTYGKIIGAGLPVGAFGGKRKFMEVVAPLGNVYQAGTLSGNPIAMRAGLALLTTLHEKHEIYKELDAKSSYLKSGIENISKQMSIPIQVNRVGSLLSIHFTSEPVTDFASSTSANSALFSKFFHNMLNEGIYLPPSSFETWFLNNAMTYEDLDKTLNAISVSINKL